MTADVVAGATCGVAGGVGGASAAGVVVVVVGQKMVSRAPSMALARAGMPAQKAPPPDGGVTRAYPVAQRAQPSVGSPERQMKQEASRGQAPPNAAVRRVGIAEAEREEVARGERWVGTGGCTGGTAPSQTDEKAEQNPV